MSNDKRTLTDSEFSSALSHISSLHAIMVALGHTAPPVSSESSMADVEATLLATYNSINGKREEKSREVMISAKKGVDGVCHAARKAAIAEYKDVLEILALKPGLKAKMGAAANPPTSTSVKLSSLVEFFPTEWDMSRVVKTLHTMNYKLTPGSKKEEDRAVFVNIGADVLEKAMKEEESEESPKSAPASRK